MKTTNIYGLIDPITKQLRYIGKSDKVNLRLRQHIKDSKKRGNLNKKEAWIKSLLNKNNKPEIKIIEVVNYNEWQSKEIYYINKYKNEGIGLLNDTNGGDGVSGYKHGKASLNKMSRTWIKKGEHLSESTEFKKGNKLSEETKKKISEGLKGIIFTPERKENIRIAQLKRSKEISKMFKDYWKNNECQKNKASIRMKGNQFAKGVKWTEERKNEMRKRRLGIPLKRETVLKIIDKVSISILQIDKMTNRVIKKWKSAKEVSRKLNISATSINNNLHGRSKTAGNFIWKYN